MNRRLICLMSLSMLLTAPAMAEWRHENPEECAKLDARLREIDSRRRAGYSAAQGRQLQAQREKLEQRRRKICR